MSVECCPVCLEPSRPAIPGWVHLCVSCGVDWVKGDQGARERAINEWQKKHLETKANPGLSRLAYDIETLRLARELGNRLMSAPYDIWNEAMDLVLDVESAVVPEPEEHVCYPSPGSCESCEP